MTLDTKALEAAEVAWRASIHPTCKGMLTAAIEAYLSATPSRNDILEEAAKPFVEFADNNIDAEGWAGSRCERDRICDWFGPSDFRAIRALVKP